MHMIPARPKESLFEENTEKKVCAYCRVSTDDPRQTSSYELQKNHYEEFIREHPGWVLVDIYADEGITGTIHTSFMHVSYAFIRLICHFTISHPRGELSPQYSRHRKHAFEFCRTSALITHWKIWCRLDEGTTLHLKKVRRGLEARLQTLCILATLQPCNLEL